MHSTRRIDCKVTSSSALVIACLVLGLAFPALDVLAASGMPDSTEFGYGVHIDPWGLQPELAINIADGIGLDWIAIEFDWARLAPEEQAYSSSTELDRAIAQAQHYNLNVLLSITNPPPWVMAPLGPDSARVNNLVAYLAGRYPATLLAIELFPLANTHRGWGTTPNPVAYGAMLQQINSTLRSMASPIVLVAGGLAQLDENHTPDDIQDIEFLSSLYAAGAAVYMPVVSLRLQRLNGTAMTSPEEGNRVLRHYEIIRQTMLVNGHDSGLIWISGYSWPVSETPGTTSVEVHWLNQALQLMKSQLYIGAAFFDSLNPAQPAGVTPTLMAYNQDQVSLHPAITALAQIIALSHGDQPPTIQFTLAKRLVSGPEKHSLKVNIP